MQDFWATVCKPFALYYRSVVCLSVLSCPVCIVGVLWPNGWTDQDETWHKGTPRPWTHCVRRRTGSPPEKGAEPLPFSAHVYCGQTAAWIKMVLGIIVGLGPGHIVLDGDPRKEGQAPPIFGHAYCGQTAGCITMPLGTEVSLGHRRHCVRWGPSSPSPY